MATLPASIKEKMKAKHIPVLLAEAIQYLNLLPGNTVVDGTFGLGGHTREIAKKVGAEGRVVGIEQDERTLKIVSQELKNWLQIELVCGNFADIDNILKKLDIEKVDAILLDLGISSYQLDSQEYGLSWQNSGPLDMRLNGDGETALEIIKNLNE